jgi:hypothetical protein
LTTAALALQQDHLINLSKEDRFVLSGLKQFGRPATGPIAQKTAGQLIMSSLLEAVFHGTDQPNIRDVFIYRGPILPRSDASLPLTPLKLLGRLDFAYCDMLELPLLWRMF